MEENNSYLDPLQSSYKYQVAEALNYSSKKTPKKASKQASRTPSKNAGCHSVLHRANAIEKHQDIGAEEINQDL